MCLRNGRVGMEQAELVIAKDWDTKVELSFLVT